MSRESNLTRLWLKWVEPESSRPWKSRIWVESESSHADRHLSQRWVNWILLESKLSHWFFEEKTSRSATFDRTPPPPPGQELFPKLGKMWWVVSQIWLNSDSTELSRSWVRLVNLDFELSRSWVRLANLGFELSRSWVTWIVIWVRVESARKMSRTQPCLQVVFTTWLHFLLWSLWQAAYDLLCSGWCPSRLLQRRKTKFCTCVYDKCGKDMWERQLSSSVNRASTRAVSKLLEWTS